MPLCTALHRYYRTVPLCASLYRRVPHFTAPCRTVPLYIQHCADLRRSGSHAVSHALYRSVSHAVSHALYRSIPLWIVAFRTLPHGVALCRYIPLYLSCTVPPCAASFPSRGTALELFASFYRCLHTGILTLSVPLHFERQSTLCNVSS
jgi:hypothetical protein